MISVSSKTVKDFIKDAKYEDEYNGSDVIEVESLDTSKDVILISMARYDELAEDSDFLNALQAAGVDNWEGYGFAQDMMEEGE